MRSPHATGDDTASPGIAVFHAMLVPLVASHRTGGFLSSPMPEAQRPRNLGPAPPRGATTLTSTAYTPARPLSHRPFFHLEACRPASCRCFLRDCSRSLFV